MEKLPKDVEHHVSAQGEVPQQVLLVFGHDKRQRVVGDDGAVAVSGGGEGGEIGTKVDAVVEKQTSRTRRARCGSYLNARISAVEKYLPRAGEEL